MKKYVVTVIDFDNGEDIDIVVEGIYQNMNEAIKTMIKVCMDLSDNAIFNGYKNIQLLHKYDKQYLLEEILILNKDKEILFQITLNETFE